MTRHEAQALIDGLVAVREGATDAVASAAVGVYPSLRYDGELIKAGTRIRRGDTLLRAAVDLWDNEQSTPETAPTLWEAIAYYKGYRIIPEIITATLAFGAGEVGYWPPHDRFYRALRDGVTHNPEDYPADWEEIT